MFTRGALNVPIVPLLPLEFHPMGESVGTSRTRKDSQLRSCSLALQRSVHVLHKFKHDLIFPSFPYQPCGPRWYFVPFCGTFESGEHVSTGKVVCLVKCVFASRDDGVKCI